MCAHRGVSTLPRLVLLLVRVWTLESTVIGFQDTLGAVHPADELVELAYLGKVPPRVKVDECLADEMWARLEVYVAVSWIVFSGVPLVSADAPRREPLFDVSVSVDDHGPSRLPPWTRIKCPAGFVVDHEPRVLPVPSRELRKECPALVEACARV